MLTAAVIGLGIMGRNHARVYNLLPNVDLVAVADIDTQALKQVVREYRVRGYKSYYDLLKQEQPDVVSVVVPTQLHRQVALDVIEAGVHLLVEKPLASTVGEGGEIIQRAEERGLKLAVGHVERFNPAIIELKRRLDRGELRKVFLIHARRLGPFPARVRDVGVVIDLATHDLDVMRYLIGCEVERVYAETARRIHTDHEDLLSGLLRFEDGTIGVLEVNWLTPTKVRELSITGERGMFVVNYLTQDLYFYENSSAGSEWESQDVLKGVGEGNMVRLRVEKQEPLRVEIDDFVDSVVNGGEPQVCGDDALAALALAQRMVEAGRCNTVLWSHEMPEEMR